ncbi:MAG: hypothetical protein QG566_764 [Patescibacteria group bacterium]|jgi:hypothetical protein|nr:hypothetical protein [Patescibacteria group bacterium]
MNKKTFKKIFEYLLYLFAIIGFIFVFIYFAIQFGWLNVRGSASQRNSYFNIVKGNNIRILEVKNEKLCVPASSCAWASSEEWALMKEVFTRDQEIIKKAANDAGIEPRILLGGIIGEQFRFFGNRRESFKQYFEPLKILASLSNTSYGIAGLKPKTLMQIEDHMKDPKSPFYLGPEMENFFVYNEGADIEKVRFNRITDVNDPYYSYLYAGLYMKQIQTQWIKSGYDISERPDVFGTLYNLGFYYSVPKQNPQSGGSIVIVNGMSYNFGDISYEFYYSDELSDIFPYDVK